MFDIGHTQYHFISRMRDMVDCVHTYDEWTEILRDRLYRKNNSITKYHGVISDKTGVLSIRGTFGECVINRHTVGLKYEDNTYFEHGNEGACVKSSTPMHLYTYYKDTSQCVYMILDNGKTHGQHDFWVNGTEALAFLVAHASKREFLVFTGNNNAIKLVGLGRVENILVSEDNKEAIIRIRTLP